MLIGVDLEKNERTLYNAYNDAAGVTARFNLNVLARINRELGGNFDLSAFTHRAIYNRRAPPDRDASRQQQAADRPLAGPQLLLSHRRKHPHRKQLQV